MTLPLPFTIAGEPDPEAIQGNFDAIKKEFPLRRRHMKLEAPAVVGGLGEVAFENGWTNYGGYELARYWKDPVGIVHLEGLLALGTVDLPAFTLPSGYLPGADLLFSTISNSAVGRIDVLTSGAVIPATPSSNVWVSLFGLTFKQEN